MITIEVTLFINSLPNFGWNSLLISLSCKPWVITIQSTPSVESNSVAIISTDFSISAACWADAVHCANTNKRVKTRV